MDISQEPFYAEIRKENAMLQRPEKSNTGLNSYCKTPSVWTHWGKILDTTWMHGILIVADEFSNSSMLID